jgi:hypothetical protein
MLFDKLPDYCCWLPVPNNNPLVSFTALEAAACVAQQAHTQAVQHFFPFACMFVPLACLTYTLQTHVDQPTHHLLHMYILKSTQRCRL